MVFSPPVFVFYLHFNSCINIITDFMILLLVTGVHVCSEKAKTCMIQRVSNSWAFGRQKIQYSLPSKDIQENHKTVNEFSVMAKR